MRNQAENRFAILGATVIVILAVSGIGITEAYEYLKTASDQISEALHEGLPVDVEIGRIDVILDRVDDQIKRQKHVLATALVALEDTESVLAKEKRECDLLMSEMKSLRNQLPASSSCPQNRFPGADADRIRRLLSTRLTTWKARTESLKILEDAVGRQRQTVDQLTMRHDEWRSKRELLSSRLLVLRTSEASHRAQSNSSNHAFSDDALTRACRLADEVETRLRISEKASSLGTSEEAYPDSLQNVEAQIDALIND